MTKDSVFLENPITTEIIRNAFISAAHEMNASLFRSAYSPVIYEAKDCSVGIFNENCQILGQSAGLPLFLGNLEVAIETAIDFYGGKDYFEEGDVYIINDSFSTGTHLNDITVFSPIFYKSRLVGFTASRAHWLDIGSKDIGFTMDSTTIYQEGVRIPPIKLVSRGEVCRDVAELICRNSRFYRNAYGDMFAQIAASRMGERRFVEILERFGYDVVQRAIHDIFLQSELMEREAIAGFPEGEFFAEGCLDNDGQTDDPVPVKLKMTIRDGHIHIDLAGSSPQVAGSTNCGLAQTISACRVAYKSLVHPEMPVTGGCFKPLTVSVPPGTIFSAEEPAAVNFYYSPLGLLIDLIIGAVESAAPELTGGAHYGDSMLIHIAGTDPRPTRNNRPYLMLEPTLGGYGGGIRTDGQDALINCVNGDLKVLPVEVCEYNYPFKVSRYELRADSAGPGKNRGGNGVIREYEAMYPDTHVYLWFERSKTRAWGVCGGKTAQGPDVVLTYPDGRQERRLKVNDLPVPPGTRVTLMTGGGGGFGDPFERDPEKVLRDVREGYLTREHAEREYGVVFDDTGDIDREATRRRRAAGCETPRQEPEKAFARRPGAV